MDIYTLGVICYLIGLLAGYFIFRPKSEGVILINIQDGKEGVKFVSDIPLTQIMVKKNMTYKVKIVKK